MKRRKREYSYVMALFKFLLIIVLLFFSKQAFKLRDENILLKLAPAVMKSSSKLAATHAIRYTKSTFDAQPSLKKSL